MRKQPEGRKMKVPPFLLAPNWAGWWVGRSAHPINQERRMNN